MAWRRPGDKPLSKPMMALFTDANMCHLASMSSSLWPSADYVKLFTMFYMIIWLPYLLYGVLICDNYLLYISYDINIAESTLKFCFHLPFMTRILLQPAITFCCILYSSFHIWFNHRSCLFVKSKHIYHGQVLPFFLGTQNIIHPVLKWLFFNYYL